MDRYSESSWLLALCVVGAWQGQSMAAKYERYYEPYLVENPEDRFSCDEAH